MPSTTRYKRGNGLLAMNRYRASIAIVCVALILFAAFTPGIPAHSFAVILDPVRNLFVPQRPTFVRPSAVRVNEQTRALLSVVVSRPPPHRA